MPIDLRLGSGSLDFYNPISLKSVNEQDLRAEYRRIRKVLRDRFRRIEKSPDFAKSQILRNNERLLSIPASKIRTVDLYSSLSSLASLASSSLSTLSGLRRQRDITLENFKEAGITGVTKANWADFQKFMKMTQIFRLAYIPYPKRSAGSEARENARTIRPALFALSRSSNISLESIMKNFKFFVDNIDAIQAAADSGKLPAHKRAYTANDVRKALGMAPEKGYASVKAAKEAAKAIQKEARSNAHKKKT